YGGVACLPLSAKQHARLAAAVRAAKLPNARVERSGDWTLLRRPGALPGSADWTHQYADAANTVVSKDKLVRAPLGLLWFGGSSNASILPRHGHGPSEQVVGGRLFIEGPSSLRAQDVYTGRILWERELPGFGKPYDNTSHQPGANALGSNYSSAPDGVYAAYGGRCLWLDPATGETIAEFTLPPAEGEDKSPGWGFVSVCDDLLIAGASPMIFDGEQPIGVKDNWDATCSAQIVVLDRHSGEVLWARDARLAFRHNTICAGDGRLFCIDRLPDAVVAKLARRGKKPTTPPALIAMDLHTGRELWTTSEEIFGTWLSYSSRNGLLIEAGRPSRDMLTDEPGDRMRAYRADDGTVVWDKSFKYQGPPLLHGDTIITQAQAFNMLTGERLMRPDPLTGVACPWSFKRMYGCNTAIASEYLLTFRSGAAGFYDLAGDGGTGNIGGFKSGCTSNLIVADGVLNAPDYTRTCTCSYQNQTSLALVHMPDVEMWTFNSFDTGDAPIKRLGLNLGAPGDRRAADGTLWLEYPVVGGPSPKLQVSVTPDDARMFRRHSSRVSGEGLSWVAASGAVGITELRVRLVPEGAQPLTYTVSLHFSEPDEVEPGRRVFDVLVQGQPVITGLDVVAQAGGRLRGLVKTVEGVTVADELVVQLRPRPQGLPPVLCGLEVVAQE
ncbi:MAG: PQQ-binding-like beta-propeller repeat protein, partial [Armatimonadetes bacterium]|nr:PQQ-binding-like beta-propeller repeat protein [Armatimonadota bacterium]